MRYIIGSSDHKQRLGLYGLGFIAVIFIGFVFLIGLLSLDINTSVKQHVTANNWIFIPDPENKPGVTRLSVPKEVRGIYWTAMTASSPQKHIGYMHESGLNTAVIDLKMDNGALGFAVHDRSMGSYEMSKPAIRDLDELLRNLGRQNIYRIARIVVMRDGVFALNHQDLAVKTRAGNLWRDNIDSLWLDPAAPEVAAYALRLGQEAYARGFDEIQYDYVRFPSDGNLGNISYPVYDGRKSKAEVMAEFFQAVGSALKADQIPVSFDLFGMTFVHQNDFNIGQRLIDVYPYADYISPMVYPSHYAPNFRGHANPALAPYDVVNGSLEDGIAMLQSELGVLPEDSRPKIRPWLQDFDIGAVYTPELIEAQILAARHASSSGWMLWNARNVYEPSDYLAGSKD